MHVLHKRLGEAVWEGALRRVTFVNGRVLTAEDLNTEWEASERHQQGLARVFGPGVVAGLEVAWYERGLRANRLTISAGLAFNQRGEQLNLASDLVLDVPPMDYRAGDQAHFLPRPPVGAPGEIRLGALVISRAEIAQRSSDFHVPANGRMLGPVGAASFEAVRFHCVMLPTSLPGTDLRTLRNRSAHLCWGTAGAAAPAAVADTAAFLADLGREGVPLALLCWQDEQLRFVDPWAVRRMVAAGGQGEDAMRLAVADAMQHQFADHIAELLRQADPDGLRAVQHFAYLPAAGVLPPGVKAAAFFAGLQTQPLHGDPAFRRVRVHEARLVDPLAVADPQARVGLWPQETGECLFFRLRHVSGDAVWVATPNGREAFAPDTPLGEVAGLLGGGAVHLVEPPAVPAPTPAPTPAPAPTPPPVVTPIDTPPTNPPIPIVPAPDPTLPPSRWHNPPPLLPEEPEEPILPNPPPETIALAGWYELDAYVAMTLHVTSLEWGRLPRGIRSWRCLNTPPARVKAWLREWALWLRRTSPDAPVDVEAIALWYDPAYLPGEVSDIPYAYVTFGEGGAYMVVSLAPGPLPPRRNGWRRFWLWLIGG